MAFEMYRIIVMALPLCVVGLSSPVEAEASPQSPREFEEMAREHFEQYCFDCHDGETKKGEERKEEEKKGEEKKEKKKERAYYLENLTLLNLSNPNYLLPPNYYPLPLTLIPSNFQLC